MQFPKLTPLQSRFAASILASAFLVVLYFTLTNPQFAYAADVDSIIPPDHNHPIILNAGGPFLDGVGDGGEEEEDLYEPEFALMDRSIIGRAPEGVTALANNAATQMNIEAGQTQNWVFPKEALAGNLSAATPGLPSLVEKDEMELVVRMELKKRQDDVVIPDGSRTLYLTMNTCLQPKATLDARGIIPPQLTLYVSQSTANQVPGPSQSSDDQQVVELVGGYASVMLDADSDVFIGVSAPNETGFEGVWNYQLAGSIDAPFHSLDTQTNLYFVDSDDHAALLVTNNLTQAGPETSVYQEWMNLTPPFGMFAHRQDDPSILGVQNSYCGLRMNAQMFALNQQNDVGEVGMTNRGLGAKPKEQFYIKNLNASTTYFGFLAMTGNSTSSGNGVVGGGGKIWKPANFSTKAEDNCALIFNLPFCSEVAYAVPASPSQNTSSLISLYDTYASNYYQNFSFSLQQIPCNATSTAQYSLVRNCDDCAAAYKTWLCAVTIPRCNDWSSRLSYLQPRNTGQAFPNGTRLSSSDTALQGSPFNQTLLSSVATNSSRNSMIDEVIQPGPYKEVLPCRDLCFDLVRSCPPGLGFSCPISGSGLESSYGERSATGDVTCSWLGAAFFLSAADHTYTISMSGTSIRLGLILGLASMMWVMI